MGNTTIVIGGPSFGGFSGLGGLGGSNFGGGGFGGFGGLNSLGSSPFNSLGLGGGLGSNSGIPGMDGTLFKLGFDALTGNLPGIIQDIAQLGQLLSGANGGQGGQNNASGIQPLPSNFGGGGNPSATGGCGGGNQANGTGGCGDSSQSQDDRINDLMKQLLQAFGPLLQALSQLLSLMMDSNGNNNSITSSLNQSRFGALQV